MKLTTTEYELLLAELTPAAERRLRVKHSLSREDREEVLQDAMIELVRRMRDKVDSPAAMLADILDKRAADKARSRARRAIRETPVGTPTDLSALTGAPAVTIEGALFATNLDAAIRTLPTEERDAFLLYELRGVDRYEAALLLDIPAPTVVSRAERAAKMIRKELE